MIISELKLAQDLIADMTSAKYRSSLYVRMITETNTGREKEEKLSLTDGGGDYSA